MVMTCKFCRSPQRAALERDLANGASYRDIAAKLDIDIASVSRHVNNCIPDKIAKATEKREISEGIHAVDALVEHYEIVREWLKNAIEGGKISEIALMLKESRKSIELSARLSGELKSPANQINLLMHPEFIWLKETIMTTLDHESQLKLTAALQTIADRGDLGGV